LPVSGKKDDADGINVKVFENVDHSEASRSYIDILDKFDALPGIQVLKQGAIERCRLREGMSVLDSGCGAGLETVRLARLVAPSGKVTGLDASQAFLAEARKRARDLRLPIEYRQGDAQRLPFADRSFDVARAERLFLYLQEPAAALAELARVTKNRGSVYVIEPDFETVTINVGNRDLVRKVLNFDCDKDTRNGWIGRELPGMFRVAGLVDVEVQTGVVVFEPVAFSPYFLEIGALAHDAGVITADELAGWQGAIKDLLKRDQLFCTITYFMIFGRVAP
jgi:ubiquinone/menaquinone biosynthesis C-methylase UbiE